MQRKDPKITNNEIIHMLTFHAHFQISALLFPSSSNYRMIHKKGDMIRTYSQPSPDLLGWVARLAPFIASVPKIDALCYLAPKLISPTPLLVVPLPIARNPWSDCP
ncbi:hypothetical protein T459_19658 [Capsicum annuum]|uniref:Uncharacterized protein n=1 Tax=Capsicum annuum TaxID=4072 RepID=A0A2G2Z2B1_CAPAN|nr:hypothetical protein T459_19658 [Capsicum annuum]